MATVESQREHDGFLVRRGYLGWTIAAAVLLAVLAGFLLLRPLTSVAVLAACVPLAFVVGALVTLVASRVSLPVRVTAAAIAVTGAALTFILLPSSCGGSGCWCPSRPSHSACTASSPAADVARSGLRWWREQRQSDGSSSPHDGPTPGRSLRE